MMVGIIQTIKIVQYNSKGLSGDFQKQQALAKRQNLNGRKKETIQRSRTRMFYSEETVRGTTHRKKLSYYVQENERTVWLEQSEKREIGLRWDRIFLRS